MSLLRNGYTDVNRAFLQAFMSRRALKIDEIKPILASILSADDPNNEVAIEDIDDRLVQSYIATANGEIHEFDLEIKSTIDQKARTRVFALVNTASDELIQIATTHSADEIAYFKRVLDEMFDTYNTPAAEIMAIQSFAALSLAKNPSHSQSTQTGTQAITGLTMKNAEDCLESLVSEGWLECSPEKFYSLTPRAIMELGTYLTQTYNTPADEEDDEDDATNGAIVERIKCCQGCKEIITVGLRCDNKACGFRLHELCEQQYFRAQRGVKVCPTCETVWTGKEPVGEKAAARRRSQGGGRGGRRSNGVPNGTGRALGRGRNGTITQVSRRAREASAEEEEENQDVEVRDADHDDDDDSD